MRLLRFSRCREVEEFRKYFEDKENRTQFGPIGNNGEIQDTADMWLMCPSCLESFTMMEHAGSYVGGTCFLMDSHFHIRDPP